MEEQRREVPWRGYKTTLRVLVILSSVISCQSRAEGETLPPLPTPPHFILNQVEFTTNETITSPHLVAAAAMGSDNGGGSGATESQTTLPPYASPSSSSNLLTKSRIIDTKYGRLQGLSLTLFPFLGTKPGSQNTAGPIKNKIVEVSRGRWLFTISILQSLPEITKMYWNGR